MALVQHLLCEEVDELFKTQAKQAAYYNALTYLDDPETHNSAATKVRPNHSIPEIEFKGMVVQIAVGPQTTRILANDIIETFRQESPESQQAIIKYLEQSNGFIASDHPDSQSRISYDAMLARLTEASTLSQEIISLA